jgi:hypothetical protein
MESGRQARHPIGRRSTLTLPPPVCLSSQVEEAYISAEEFCRVVQQDPSVCLRNEVALLQGLRFDLVQHTPLWPLRGFFQDFQAHTTLRQHSCMHACTWGITEGHRLGTVSGMGCEHVPLHGSVCVGGRGGSA